MIRSVLGYLLCLSLILLLGIHKANDKKQYFIDVKNNYKYIVFGILLQVFIAFLLVKGQLSLDNKTTSIIGIQSIINVITSISNFIFKIKDATIEGTKFVFGYLGGGSLPFELKEGSNAFIFAFQALPMIILVGALSAILTHLKLIQFISKVLGSAFKFIFNIKDSIGTVSIAKIFLGQIEAPLLIKDKLSSLKQFDTLIILSLAFSTSSASVMPIYADVLKGICPNPLNHLIISNIINVISTLLVCRILIPKQEEDDINIKNIENEDILLVNNSKKPYKNLIDAISNGISSGAGAWWGIVCALIGMVALVYFINYLLSLLPEVNDESLSLQRIVALIMYPITLLLNIKGEEAMQISQILGTKMVINETVAFFDLAKSGLSTDSIIKSIYAINNFGNFACIGITANGLLSIAPQQTFITKTINTAFLCGFIATILTTTLIGVFL